MRLAVVVVLGASACADDPTLRVDVEHEVEVDRTTISVYESENLTCGQIEFGDLGEDELVATRVAQLAIDEGGAVSGSLDGLSRTEPKVIVVRGYVDDGLMTAGCVTKGTIVGQDAVLVKTVRASSASIGQLSVDSVDPFSLQVSLRDANGAALGNNRLAWRVYAPFGAVPAVSPFAPTTEQVSGVWHLAQPTCTNENGVRRIHPVPPATVGGFAVQVLPSWPIETPPLVTGFSRFDAAVHATVPVPAINHPCAIRRGGATAPSLLCIEAVSSTDTTLVLREYLVSETAGDVRIMKNGGDQPIDQEVIALYAVDRPTARDVYAVNQRGRIFGLGTPSVPAPAGSPPNLVGELAADALLMPACGTQPPRLLLRTAAPLVQRLVVMPELGGSAAPFHDLATQTVGAPAPRSVGCIAELGPKGDATPRQAVVVDVPPRSGTGGRLVRSVYFDCVLGDSPNCFVDLPISAAGASFTPDGFLAGVNLDASGVVVSQWGVLLDPTGYRRVEFGRVAAASIPKHIVHGDFDSDGKSDAFWDIENLDRTASTFQVTYAQLAGPQQLSALSQSQPFVVDDLLVGDVTGDGKDDLILIGKSLVEAVNSDGYGILVIPTQVPAAVPGIRNGDDPC